MDLETIERKLERLDARYGNEGNREFIEPVTGERLSDLITLVLALASEVADLKAKLAQVID